MKKSELLDSISELKKIYYKKEINLRFIFVGIALMFTAVGFGIGFNYHQDFNENNIHESFFVILLIVSVLILIFTSVYYGIFKEDIETIYFKIFKKE